MKTNSFVFGLTAVLAGGLFAAPTVSVTQMRQESGVVKIDYALANEAAIVTVDFQTNGVTIGEANFTNIGGDVNRLVTPGDHAITWKAYKSWRNRRARVKAVVTAWTPANPPDYMVIDLTQQNAVSYYVSTNALPNGGLANDDYRLSKMVFRKIAARGRQFRMGPGLNEKRGTTGMDEYPMLASFSEDYYLGIYPVTQRQYMYIQGLSVSPCNFKSEHYGNDDYLMGPFESIPCNSIRGGVWMGSDALTVQSGAAPAADSLVANVRALAGLEQLDLPTEAQWEFACRAGTTTKFWWGDADITSVRGNINQGVKLPGNKTIGSFSYRTSRVDAYPPNPWGLYDLYGNVEELCLDWAKAQQKRPPACDYVGPGNSDCSLASHVTKGGGCQLSGAVHYRSAWHNAGLDQKDNQRRGIVGARLCCTIR